MQAKVISASEVATFDVLGLPHTVLVGEQETASGYEIVQITGAAGAGVPLHVHENEDETFYVAKGEAVFVLDGREVVAPAGSAANLPRGIPHGFRITQDYTRLLLTIVPGGLAPMFAELAALPPGEPDLAAVAGICEKFGIRFV